MADALTIKFNADDALKGLDLLGEKAKAQVRPAAQAGAQVFYDQVKMNAPISEKEHWFHGTSFRKTGTKYLFQPGNLKKSVYQVYSKDNSSESVATYHIAWNHQKAPYGFMVEFGTSRAPSHPFLRPAYDEKAHEAIEAARDKFAEGMSK